MNESQTARHVSRETIAMLRRIRRRRGRDWVVYAPLLVAAVGLVYLCSTAPPPSISREVYDQIQPGLTEREVERLVGTRPGGYESFFAPGEQLGVVWGTPSRWGWWGSRDGVLSVGYDDEGRACAKGLEHHPGVPPAPRPSGWWGRLVSRSVPERLPTLVYIGPF